MLDLEFVSNFLYANLDKVSVKPNKNGREFIARCPLCGDSKKSLTKRRFHLKYENENKIVYICFNCHKTGSFIELYSILNGISISEAFKTLKKVKFDSIKQVLKKKKAEKVVSNNPNEIVFQEFSDILKDCLSVNSIPDGIMQSKLLNCLKSFINDRKIDKSYPLYVAYRGYWKNRIIIPIYDNNNLVYFQGRAIFQSDNKYLNPKSEKKNIILNKNNFSRDKYIVICEGIFDALSIGPQGTICLGASIDDKFIKKVAEYTDVGIIIALDNDKTGKEQLLKTINESIYRNKLKYFIFPNKYNHIKDLNELKIEDEKINIYDFIVKNSYNNISAKLKC